MTNSSPQPTAALPDPDPQRYQRVPEYLTKIHAHGFPQKSVLTPALRTSDDDASRWLPFIGPAQPQPTSAPVKGIHCPQAVPFQQLTLESLNNDFLAIVVDFICDAQKFDVKHRKHRYDVPKTSFDYRTKGNSLFCLALVSKRMRAICMPKLFSNVFRYGSSMGDLNRRLRDIEGNPLIPSLPLVLPAIKTCDIVTTSEGKTTFCRTRLAKILLKMESLAELSITHRKEVDISGLKATFQRHNVTLPSIMRLRILSHGSWPFMVEACPNVETLALEYNLDHDDLMHSAGALRKLKHLEICRDTWCNKDIQRLHKFFPGIQSLALRGTLGQEQISTFAESFGLFSKLAHLAMTAIQQVTDEDFEDKFSDDGSGRGSVFGEMQWEHELDEEQSFVAKTFFEHCPALGTLSLVRTGEITHWQPIRRSDGSLEFVHSPPRETFRARVEFAKLGVRRRYDCEGFPIQFSFPRQVKICDERFDPPSYGYESREAERYRVRERDRYYTIKQEAFELDLWEGGSRMFD